jgi:hypothetical protein
MSVTFLAQKISKKKEKMLHIKWQCGPLTIEYIACRKAVLLAAT